MPYHDPEDQLYAGPKPPCPKPKCGRTNWRETDASGGRGGNHFRVYRKCDCGHAWTVLVNARTGEERIELAPSKKTA